MSQPEAVAFERDATRLTYRLKKLADEVLGPLGATPGVKLSVTIEAEATAPGGFDDANVRTVCENDATAEVPAERVRGGLRRGRVLLRVPI